MRTVSLAGSILALTVCGATASAQTTYPLPTAPAPSPYATPVTVQPLTDADLLASELRLLAVDPQNLQALIRAGELALKLDDDTGAAAFFARAGRIDPRNARVKAGEGSLLVAAERPGDALRHFAEAQALGGDPRLFAADRGLAYDLVGEQERAQRDYRVALKAGPNDETQRRYALSLGISGKRELALAQIDPLLRRSDRGAWRTRAFILAMGGDKVGAEKIATSMMPTGMAQGLQAFFEILPTLRPADRAFAVHFGEVRATPERRADAQLVPPLAALGPDPTAPVEPTPVARPLVVVDAREAKRRAKAARRAGKSEQIAALTTPPLAPLPAPPGYSGQAVAAVSSVPVTRPSVGAPVYLASNTPRLPAAAAPASTLRGPAPAYVERALPRVTGESIPKALVPAPTTVTPRAVLPAAQPAIVPRAAISTPVVTPTPAPTAAAVTPPAATASVSTVQPTSSVATAAPTTPAPTIAAPAPATQSAATPPIAAPSAGTASPTAAAAPALTYSTPPSPEPSPAPVVTPTLVAVPPSRTPTPVRSEESILAAIIADIKVPGTERTAETEAVAPPAPAPVRRAPVSKPVAVAARTSAEPVALDRKAADKKAKDEKLADETTDDKKVADKKATDKKAADKKAAADKQALADKKAAEAKKLADAKKAAEEKKKKDPKFLEPSRVWVQVSGGANENDLPKQWAKVRTQSKAFGGKGGWTTPLRATNRILTGPFKTESEAQSFVNTIAKDGLSGFVFVSDAGQKITKLAGK